MNRLRFLFDECVNYDIVRFLNVAEPAVEILVVGRDGVLHKNAKDPEIYQAAVSQGRVLVSGDRRTMVATVADDLRSGGHNHGVMFLRPSYKPVSVGSDLHLTWYCESAEDWIDRIDYLPY